jgi:hypothetical protein
MCQLNTPQQSLEEHYKGCMHKLNQMIQETQEEGIEVFI